MPETTEWQTLSLYHLDCFFLHRHTCDSLNAEAGTEREEQKAASNEVGHLYRYTVAKALWESNWGALAFSFKGALAGLSGAGLTASITAPVLWER